MAGGREERRRERGRKGESERARARGVGRESERKRRAPIRLPQDLGASSCMRARYLPRGPALACCPRSTCGIIKPVFQPKPKAPRGSALACCRISAASTVSSSGV